MNGILDDALHVLRWGAQNNEQSASLTPQQCDAVLDVIERQGERLASLIPLPNVGEVTIAAPLVGTAEPLPPIATSIEHDERRNVGEGGIW